MEQEEYIKTLVEKYLDGRCTEQEIRTLFAHFELSDHEEMLRQFVRSAVEGDHDDQPAVSDRLDALTARVEARLFSQLQPRQQPWSARWLSPRKFAVAATILAVLSIGTFLYIWKAGPEKIAIAQEDVLPGGNLATLTLEDGSVVQLSTEQRGIVVGDGVTYLDGTTVGSRQSEKREAHTEVERMALTTPKGGTYQLRLPDGTNVWLNAASTLRYPSRFVGNERVVFLAGEAYFEVSHQQSATGKRIPFLVVSEGQTVEVLGTQFNVAAYPDSEGILTTLVEGAVKVISGGGEPPARTNQRPVTLRPGEQSTVKDGHAVVHAVDVNAFIGWKDGLFSFRETEMRQAMKQLARWYDVDIVYEGQPVETYFFGDIRRNKSLAHVLAILKKSGVNFRIDKQEGRHRIIVTP